MRNVTLLFAGSIGLLIAGCSGAVDTESQTGSVITADGGTSDAYVAPCSPANCFIDGECVEPGAYRPESPCELCVPAVSVSLWTTTDGEVCDDGDPCTEEGRCQEGRCIGTPVNCDDGLPCTENRCDSSTGECLAEASAEGESCDDGDPCTQGATCVEGSCASGTPIECEDDNPCTASACEEGVGCVHPPADGLTCEDGDLCTGGGVCAAGQCESSFSVTCDDESVCTADGCDPTIGCVFTDLAELCDDQNPCTNPLCDPVEGCQYAFNADPCDDGDLCTESDQCGSGFCSGEPVNLDDQNPCTDDSCEPEVGVIHSPNSLPCDDQNACTVGDTCDASLCAPGADTLECEDQNVCTADSCEPDSGCVFSPTDGDCDDASVCTLEDHCEEGVCVGDPLDCDDGNDCTADSCHPVNGCGNTLIVSHACRPTIIVTYPPRAATIVGEPGSPTVTVAGEVSSGAGAITSFSLNGEPVEVNEDGSFTHDVSPVTGGNTLVFEATDSFATTRTKVQSYHWSVEYVSDAPPQAGHADPGLGIFLAQEVLDDGDRSLPADDLATLIELVLAEFDVSAVIPTDGPVVEDVSGYDVYLKNPTYTKPKASLTSILGGLELGVVIPDLKADLDAEGNNWWNPDLSGELSVDKITITAVSEIYVTESNQLQVTLVSTSASIEGANVEIDSWLAFILEPIINGVLDGALDDLEDEVADEMESQIGPLIAETLATLAINQSFSVPSLDPSSDSEIELNLSTDFSDTDFATDGGAIILRTAVTGAAAIEHDKLGAVARSGCGELAQNLVIPRSSPLEVILADDTLNLLLFRAWEGGMLAFDVPPELLGDTDLSAYGISDLTLTANGLLAPVVSDCYQDGALRVHLGDLEVTANMTLLGSQLDVTIYMSLLAGFQLSTADNEISFGLTEVQTLDLEVTAEQDAFIPSEQLIADLVAENLTPALLDGLGGDALGGIPLPSIDLSGALDGIPPGTVIAIDVETLERETGNTIVSGDLQ